MLKTVRSSDPLSCANDSNRYKATIFSDSTWPGKRNVSTRLDDSSFKSDKAEPALARDANGCSLSQIGLAIGDSIQLQVQSDLEQPRCIVTLIGYLEGQSLIVTTPVVNGSMLLIREGQDFVVRLFSGKSAYAFAASAKRVTNTPYPHIHLSYPKAVRGMIVRASPRGRTNIICHATTENGRGVACVARDISLGGVLISANSRIGEVGDPLTLNFRVKIADTEHMLTMGSTIRSVNTSRADNAKPEVLHGLSFDSIGSQETLVISTLLYQNMVWAQSEAA
ncbi:flagellar brake protein [Betaproteobacteria bacterium SCN1]|nr:flagellar brake protein [Betaproteobacteria bacterium SCN1]